MSKEHSIQRGRGRGGAGGYGQRRVRESHGRSGMLGQRQVTPGWADDPVQIQDGRRWREFRVSRGLPPPEEHRTAVGEAGRVKISYITIRNGA